MAKFLRHINCESCGSSDANAQYSNGGSYCFSCGAVGGANRPGFIRTEGEKGYTIPNDLSHDFPEVVLRWVQPTGITVEELIRNAYYYSHSKRWLVRLLENGCFECRRMESHDTGPKALFFGEKSSVRGGVGFRKDNFGQPVVEELYGNCVGLQTCSNPTLQPPPTQRACVLVEDSLSAIKCGRAIDAFPLFGSSVSNDKLAMLVKDYNFIYVWLDSDKYISSQNISNRVELLGKKALCIYSDLDPKYLNPMEYFHNAYSEEHDD